MPPEIVPIFISSVFFVVTGGVLILRPITKRLGGYLEVLAEERRRAAAPPPRDDERLIAALEALDRRLARLEDRQEFTDALLSHRQSATMAARSDHARAVGEAEAARISRTEYTPLVGGGPQNG